jgi:hypothetical protein
MTKSSPSPGLDVPRELAGSCRLPSGEEVPEELGIVLGPVPPDPFPELPIPSLLLVRTGGMSGGSGVTFESTGKAHVK